MGLRARPIATTIWDRVSPAQGLISVDSEELDGVQIYQKLKEVREGYVYPEHHHNKQDQNQISKELQEAEYVLVRIDFHRPPLKTPYEGPYKVLEKSTYTFTIFNGRTEDKVSVDRSTTTRKGRDPERPLLQEGRQEGQFNLFQPERNRKISRKFPRRVGTHSKLYPSQQSFDRNRSIASNLVFYLCNVMFVVLFMQCYVR